MWQQISQPAPIQLKPEKLLFPQVLWFIAASKTFKNDRKHVPLHHTVSFTSCVCKIFLKLHFIPVFKLQKKKKKTGYNPKKLI